MAACDCSAGIRTGVERRTLIAVLAINAVMFVVELLLGLMVQSTGLIADSLDMLADALVYGISLSAVAGCRSPSPPWCWAMGCGAPSGAVSRWAVG